MMTAAYRIANEGLYPPIPSETPEQIQQLLKDCWQFSPSQRPFFEEICARIKFWNVDNSTEPSVSVNPISDYATLGEYQ